MSFNVTIEEFMKLDGVKINNKVANIGFLDIYSSEFPKSAVIHPNGAYIEAEFGMHMIVANILKSIFEIDNKEIYDECVTDNVFEPVFSRMLPNVDFSKPDVVKIMEGYSDFLFLGKYGTNLIGKNVIMDKIVENWLDEYAYYVWAIRVVIYMLDEDKEYWWGENTRTQFNDLFKERIGVTLPSKKWFLEQPFSDNAFFHRGKFIDIIENAFGKKKDIVKKVMKEYPDIREYKCGKSYGGSLWDNNYIDNDMDAYLFDRKENKSQKYIAKSREIEIEKALSSEQDYVEIKDSLIGKTLKVLKDNLEVIRYSNSITFNLKAEDDIVLKNKLYPKGAYIKGFSFDEYVTIV